MVSRSAIPGCFQVRRRSVLISRERSRRRVTATVPSTSPATGRSTAPNWNQSGHGGRHQDADARRHHVTGTAIAIAGAVKVDATTTLKLSGVHLTGGAIEISAPSMFRRQLDVGDILTNTNAALTVDAGQTLILDGTEIIGGTINDNGTVSRQRKYVEADGTTVIGGTITDDGTTTSRAIHDQGRYLLQHGV